MAEGDHSAAGPGREWLIPSTLVLSLHKSDGIEGIYTIIRGKAVSKKLLLLKDSHILPFLAEIFSHRYKHRYALPLSLSHLGSKKRKSLFAGYVSIPAAKGFVQSLTSTMINIYNCM